MVSSSLSKSHFSLVCLIGLIIVVASSVSERTLVEHGIGEARISVIVYELDVEASPARTTPHSALGLSGRAQRA